ncbi:sensory transduction histidine kinase [Nonlabens tegetincola]|uniref:histidine kinase n=1 Tax=Nonlabens tegetincola TaxID=323273 RepID=A0A090QJY5_9FLAO|nr:MULTISPECIES: PAS domain-containing sensor histidine kinase [Nonlabens]ALM21031.1 histidine kinase [Nonlabens sp. MIC269]ARN72252.1 PAS domain-containing sensor histidine kinase [Nonlabens tegetincola]GAK95846.1 sensory transduction histidine kinase [Nonlabens tegetincola]
MSQNEIDILKRALSREKMARKQAEKILEEKSADLYKLTQELKSSNQQLEKLIYEKNSQLQGVFENIVDAYVIMDLQGKVLKMNDSAIELLEQNNEEKEFSLLELVKDNDLDHVANGFNKLITKGSITNFQIHIHTKSGKTRLVHINASIIKNEEGKPVAAQGIVRDITLDAAYQKAVEAERIKYRSIIDNMNIGLVEVNSKDEIQLVNRRFIEMTGYQEEELIGRNGKDFLLIEAEKKIFNPDETELIDDGSYTYELKIKNKNQETKYWLSSGIKNVDVKGNQLGSIRIHLDITDFKNLQLQKEDLVKSLEKSNNELKEYAHIVSHDLKSPLRSINALVSWLREDNKGILNDSSIQNIELIESTLEKMESLISGILEYSVLDKNVEAFKKVNLESLISEVIEMIYVPDHIQFKINNKFPIINGDKIKLQQLFQNLIANAIKYNDKDLGIITLSCKDQGSFYEFAIEDNGIGIEEQYHQKIFKIFHALHHSKDSSGIGLSIVKKIVNLHGGEIWLDSTPNQGTTFYFTLKK